MEVRRAEDWQKPLPNPDETAKPFYAAAARGELLYQRCPACGHVQFYPRFACTKCGAEPEWATASGRGTVHTFTVVRQNFSPVFRDELPYVVAMVELDEGVKMMTNLTDCAVEDVHIGMPVEAWALEVDEGVGIPFWKPA